MFHCVKVNPGGTKFFKTKFEKDIISKKRQLEKNFRKGYLKKTSQKSEKKEEKIDKKALSSQKTSFLILYDKNTRALGGKRAKLLDSEKVGNRFRLTNTLHTNRGPKQCSNTRNFVS